MQNGTVIERLMWVEEILTRNIEKPSFTYVILRAFKTKTFYSLYNWHETRDIYF